MATVGVGELEVGEERRGESWRQVDLAVYRCLLGPLNLSPSPRTPDATINLNTHLIFTAKFELNTKKPKYVKS